MPFFALPVACLILALSCGANLTAADTASVPQSAEAAVPLAVGAAAPQDAALHTVDGKATTVGKALAGQPTVVIFYRGGWCPFCTRQLAGLREIVPGLTEAGWKIIAIAPDAPETLRAAAADEDGLRRFSDAEGHAMRAFGVAFHVDDATQEKLQGYGIDLAKASGQNHRLLPVPSVFAIDGTGVIRFAHVNPDYKARMDAQELLSTVKKPGAAK